MTLDYKRSLKSLGYICSNNQKYIVWVIIIDFSLMPKIIRILSSCKCSTVNISKLNFWLVICIAKNFIWTTLKMIFSIFRWFCTLRFQIFKYCPIITNIIYSAFRWCINLNKKKDPYDWFCGPGSHIIVYIIITIILTINSSHSIL